MNAETEDLIVPFKDLGEQLVQNSGGNSDVWKSSSELGAEAKERRLDPKEPGDKLPGFCLLYQAPKILPASTCFSLTHKHFQHPFNDHPENKMGKDSCPHRVAMLVEKVDIRNQATWGWGT